MPTFQTSHIFTINIRQKKPSAFALGLIDSTLPYSDFPLFCSLKKLAPTGSPCPMVWNS